MSIRNYVGITLATIVAALGGSAYAGEAPKPDNDDAFLAKLKELTAAEEAKKTTQAAGAGQPNPQNAQPAANQKVADPNAGAQANQQNAQPQIFTNKANLYSAERIVGRGSITPGRSNQFGIAYDNTTPGTHVERVEAGVVRENTGQKDINGYVIAKARIELKDGKYVLTPEIGADFLDKKGGRIGMGVDAVREGVGGEVIYHRTKEDDETSSRKRQRETVNDPIVGEISVDSKVLQTLKDVKDYDELMMSAYKKFEDAFGGRLKEVRASVTRITSEDEIKGKMTSDTYIDFKDNRFKDTQHTSVDMEAWLGQAAATLQFGKVDLYPSFTYARTTVNGKTIDEEIANQTMVWHMADKNGKVQAVIITGTERFSEDRNGVGGTAQVVITHNGNTYIPEFGGSYTQGQDRSFLGRFRMIMNGSKSNEYAKLFTAYNTDVENINASAKSEDEKNLEKDRRKRDFDDAVRKMYIQGHTELGVAGNYRNSENYRAGAEVGYQLSPEWNVGARGSIGKLGGEKEFEAGLTAERRMGNGNSKIDAFAGVAKYNGKFGPAAEVGGTLELGKQANGSVNGKVKN
jgi:hypothetical protein